MDWPHFLERFIIQRAQSCFPGRSFGWIIILLQVSKTLIKCSNPFHLLGKWKNVPQRIKSFHHHCSFSTLKEVLFTFRQQRLSLEIMGEMCDGRDMGAYPCLFFNLFFILNLILNSLCAANTALCSWTGD